MKLAIDMQTNIRKWGNSAGTIIPAPVLAAAGLRLGDAIEIEVVDGAIVIRRTAPTYRLEDLLAATPQDKTSPDEEDREWLHDAPMGRELD